MSREFEQRIRNHEVTVGVVGLGYVGLPLSVDFAKSGFRVIGIDVDEDKVARLNTGENYVQDVDDAELKRLVDDGKFTATGDYSAIEEIDALSICVPTPLNKLKDPDVSFILNALDEIVKYMHPDLLVVLESTTYPGTTRELVLPKLEESGLTVGEDFYLVFSPERVDPGNKDFHTKNTPKVLGGITDECNRIGRMLYEEVIEQIVPVSSTEAAELVKLLENTFRSINIGLVNEMAIMAEKLGVNIWEVIDAADTKPFGFMKFYPGPGLGGHCIPIDPHYLAWKMKSLDYKARFIELAGEINTEMPYHVVQLIMEGLNRHKKSVNGAKILVLGVSYKPDIDDVRESPALDVIRLLQEKGAEVEYYDPYVENIHLDGDRFATVEYSGDRLANYDCCVITTDHSDFDYGEIADRSQLVVDTRNAIRIPEGGKRDNVIKLGGNNT